MYVEQASRAAPLEIESCRDEPLDYDLLALHLPASDFGFSVTPNRASSRA